MRIAYNNKADDGVLSGVANVNYPLINLQEQRLAKPWRSPTGSAQTVVCAFTAATVITTIGVIEHNLASGDTVTIEANAADAWTAPSFTTSLTYTSNMILKYIAGETYKYWRFVFQTTEEYVQAGRIWLGEYITIDPSSLINFNVKLKRNDNVNYGRGRQKFSVPGIAWREFKLTFPKTAYATVDLVKTMFEDAGNWQSLIFCNLDTARDYDIIEPCYCSIVGDINFNHTKGMHFIYKLILEEDK